jgi:broad specificity phosphatase PhoE
MASALAVQARAVQARAVQESERMRRVTDVGIACVLAVLMFWSPSSFAQPVVSTVVLVRHAEPASGSSDDPGLSPAGRKRADDLAIALRDRTIAAIVVSPFRRTQETARPIAGALRLTPVIVPLTSIDAHVQSLAEQVRRHAGKTVLVVGHSNTVPLLVAALGGPPMASLCEDTFDRLFVLTTSDGKTSVARSLYGDRSFGAASNCP